MGRYRLTIELQSPLSAGSGDSLPGIVDQEIAHEHGLPIIPAKRLKGALRGVAKEFVDWQFVNNDQVNRLFGVKGSSEGSGFKITDAVLSKLPPNYLFEGDGEIVDDYESFRCSIVELNEQSVLEQFTKLYTQTAIENNGAAKTGTLRTLRAVNAGLVFTSTIEIKNSEDYRLLENCVKGLRRLGYHRTRGFGEVICRISKQEGLLKQSEHTSFPSGVKTEDEKARTEFTIRLKEPALIAGEDGLYYSCANFIPGSVLIGVFAGLYIKKYKREENAHEKPEFKRLFIDGDIKFGYAYPTVGERSFFPCPGYVQREKNCDKAYTSNSDGRRNLRKIQSLAAVEKETIYLHEPKKEYRMHHSRPENRAYGRAIHDTKGSEEIRGDKGQFYYYTALSKEQQFSGELRGKQQDIELLIELLDTSGGNIQIGRSRTAEYGAAVMTIDSAPKDARVAPYAKEGSRRAVIYAESPVVMQDKFGQYNLDSTNLIREISIIVESKLTIERVHLKQTTLRGYHAKWRLPKPEYPAFDSGTTWIVSSEEKNTDWSKVDDHLWGEETARGCGRLYSLAYEEDAEFQIENAPFEVSNSEHSLADTIKQKIEEDEKFFQVLATVKEDLFIQKLKSYSNTKIYQIERYVTDGIELPKKFSETEKEALDSQLKNRINSFPLSEERKKELIKKLFHHIRLEVRLDGG